MSGGECAVVARQKRGVSGYLSVVWPAAHSATGSVRGSRERAWPTSARSVLMISALQSSRGHVSVVDVRDIVLRHLGRNSMLTVRCLTEECCDRRVTGGWRRALFVVCFFLLWLWLVSGIVWRWWR